MSRFVYSDFSANLFDFILVLYSWQLWYCLACFVPLTLSGCSYKYQNGLQDLQQRHSASSSQMAHYPPDYLSRHAIVVTAGTDFLDHTNDFLGKTHLIQIVDRKRFTPRFIQSYICYSWQMEGQSVGARRFRRQSFLNQILLLVWPLKGWVKSPWNLDGVLVLAQRVQPFLRVEDYVFQSVLTWVRLPLQYWF